MAALSTKGIAMRLSYSHRSLVLGVAALVLAGCATAPPPAAPPVQPKPVPAAPAKAEPAAPVAPPAPAAPIPPRVTPHTLDLTRPADDVWQRIRHGYAVPNIDTPLVKQWEEYYVGKPDYIARMTGRASRYLYYVLEQLEKRGMPTELALLPFVESAYNPTAYSHAHAAGMWQFIPSTGKSYNLKQDWWKDERRDVIASTNAALDYLQYLFEFHGDWHLALASYNWGEGAVKRAIDKNRARSRPTDYLSLDMPNETRNYVPKLQAIKNLVAHPERYQVVLPKIENEPYFVTVRIRDIDIATAAKLAGLTIEDFKALNPSYHRPFIPSGENTEILLPADKAAAFLANLEQHDGPLSSWTTYRVSKTATVQAIAKRLNIDAATLASANQLSLFNTVKVGKGKKKRTVTRPSVVAAGTLLAVPRVQLADKTEAEPERAAKKEQAAGPDRNAVRTATYTVRKHVVRRGETLFSIAKLYGVTVDQLKAANRLRSMHVRVGTRLTIAAGPEARPATQAPVRAAPKLAGE
jgi:membrane-bound lytic murein transglycosylase D